MRRETSSNRARAQPEAAAPHASLRAKIATTSESLQLVARDG
jgi:hypothetical protein